MANARPVNAGPVNSGALGSLFGGAAIVATAAAVATMSFVPLSTAGVGADAFVVSGATQEHNNTTANAVATASTTAVSFSAVSGLAQIIAPAEARANAAEAFIPAGALQLVPTSLVAAQVFRTKVILPDSAPIVGSCTSAVAGGPTDVVITFQAVADIHGSAVVAPDPYLNNTLTAFAGMLPTALATAAAFATIPAIGGVSVNTAVVSAHGFVNRVVNSGINFGINAIAEVSTASTVLQNAFADVVCNNNELVGNGFISKIGEAAVAAVSTPLSVTALRTIITPVDPVTAVATVTGSLHNLHFILADSVASASITGTGKQLHSVTAGISFSATALVNSDAVSTSTKDADVVMVIPKEVRELLIDADDRTLVVPAADNLMRAA